MQRLFKSSSSKQPLEQQRQQQARTPSPVRHDNVAINLTSLKNGSVVFRPGTNELVVRSSREHAYAQVFYLSTEIPYSTRSSDSLPLSAGARAEWRRGRYYFVPAGSTDANPNAWPDRIAFSQESLETGKAKLVPDRNDNRLHVCPDVGSGRQIQVLVEHKKDGSDRTFTVPAILPKALPYAGIETERQGSQYYVIQRRGRSPVRPTDTTRQNTSASPSGSRSLSPGKRARESRSISPRIPA